MIKRKKKPYGQMPPPPKYDTPSGEEQYKKTLEENRPQIEKSKSADEVTSEEEETLRETMRKQVEESNYKRGGMVKSKARGCGIAVRGLTKGRMY